MANMKSSECPHMKEINTEVLEVDDTVCAECGLNSPTRICMTCGHIGCCESANGHALAHSKSSKHLLIRQLPISDNSFTWCYGCNAYLT